MTLSIHLLWGKQAWKSSLAVFESRQPEECELLNFCAVRPMVCKFPDLPDVKISRQVINICLSYICHSKYAWVYYLCRQCALGAYVWWDHVTCFWCLYSMQRNEMWTVCVPTVLFFSFFSILFAFQHTRPLSVSPFPLFTPCCQSCTTYAEKCFFEGRKVNDCNSKLGFGLISVEIPLELPFFQRKTHWVQVITVIYTYIW